MTVAARPTPAWPSATCSVDHRRCCSGVRPRSRRRRRHLVAPVQPAASARRPRRPPAARRPGLPATRGPLLAVGLAAGAGMLVHALAGHAAGPSSLRLAEPARQWTHLLAAGSGSRPGLAVRRALVPRHRQGRPGGGAALSSSPGPAWPWWWPPGWSGRWTSWGVGTAGRQPVRAGPRPQAGPVRRLVGLGALNRYRPWCVVRGRAAGGRHPACGGASAPSSDWPRPAGRGRPAQPAGPGEPRMRWPVKSAATPVLRPAAPTGLRP